MIKIQPGKEGTMQDEVEKGQKPDMQALLLCLRVVFS